MAETCTQMSFQSEDKVSIIFLHILVLESILLLLCIILAYNHNIYGIYFFAIFSGQWHRNKHPSSNIYALLHGREVYGLLVEGYLVYAPVRRLRVPSTIYVSAVFLTRTRFLQIDILVGHRPRGFLLLPGLQFAQPAPIVG